MKIKYLFLLIIFSFGCSMFHYFDDDANTLNGGNTINDTTPPSITIISPANQSALPTKSVSILGTAEDSESGVAGVYFSFEGEEQFVLVSDKQVWKHDINLPNGKSVLCYYAVDNSGNKSEVLKLTLHFYGSVDLIVTSFQNGHHFATDTIKLQGSITKDDPDLEVETYLSTTLKPNGVPSESIKIGDGDTIDYEIQGLADGRYDINVIVRRKGEDITLSSKLKNIVIDTTKPVISITNAKYEDGSLKINGKYTEVNIKSIFISLNNGSYIEIPPNLVSNGGWSYSYNTISQGTHNISVYGEDKAGNVSDITTRTAVVTFPQILWISPLPSGSAFSKNDMITFKADISSTIGLKSYQWFDGLTSLTSEMSLSGVGPFTQILTKKGSELGGYYGQHTIKLRVKDIDDVVNEDTIVVNILDDQSGGFTIQF